MSDIRALLKAKRQEIRITHPFASYSTSGDLRCTICQSLVKHASAWEGHLGSKTHRISVARQKERERTNERKRIPEPHHDKRRAEENTDAEDRRTKKHKADELEKAEASSVLLSNLERGERTTDASALAQEWDNFKRMVLDVPDQPEVYERATTVGEPELVPENLVGLPAQSVEDTSKSAAVVDAVTQEKERDERELIMDRLLEEEQAQEEADLRVSIMKGRLEALKSRRQAAKSAKNHSADRQ